MRDARGDTEAPIKCGQVGGVRGCLPTSTYGTWVLGVYQLFVEDFLKKVLWQGDPWSVVQHLRQQLYRAGLCFPVEQLTCSAKASNM